MGTNEHNTHNAGAATPVAALDALIEAGWNAERVDPALREHARKLQALFRAIDAQSANAATAGAADKATLIDVTMARVLRARSLSVSDATPATAVAPLSLPSPLSRAARLAPMDEEAADAWVRADFRADRVPSDLRDRVARHAGLADLLAAGLSATSSTAQRHDLIDRTMRAVTHAAPVASDVIPISRGRSFGRVRLADLATAAAAVIVLGAVLWPMISAFRGSAMRTACQANMAMLATGMSSYAESSQDSLPVATASFGDARWWDVGRLTSNSANLFKLYRDGFVASDALACPGNPNACSPKAALPADASDWQKIEQVSYSMQILRGPDRPNWVTSERRPIMADRSPVVLASLHRRAISPEASSPNHGGYGQFLLMSDGSAEWRDSPVLDNGDNIWLPRLVENVIRVMRNQASPEILKGTEVPGKNDAFFGP
jgi:hypothetical protein